MAEAENTEKDFWIVFTLKVKCMKVIKHEKKAIEKTGLKGQRNDDGLWQCVLDGFGKMRSEVQSMTVIIWQGHSNSITIEVKRQKVNGSGFLPELMHIKGCMPNSKNPTEIKSHPATLLCRYASWENSPVAQSGHQSWLFWLYLFFFSRNF